MSFEQSVNEDTIPVAKQVLIGIHGMGTLYLSDYFRGHPNVLNKDT